MKNLSSLISFFQKVIFSFIGFLLGGLVFIIILKYGVSIHLEIVEPIFALGIAAFLFKKYHHEKIIKYLSLGVMIFSVLYFVLLLIGAISLSSILL